MNIEDFLSKLEKVEADGEGGWMACCPGHDDHNPSMHVNVGADGRILVKCFTGCSTEDIVAGMGLKLKDLMPEKGKRKRKISLKTAAKYKRDVDRAVAELKKGDKKKAKPLPLSAAPKKPRDYGKLQREYFYKREDGAIVFKVQRRILPTGKKTFTQMSPDPDRPGHWRYGVDKHGVAYIPFQVPLIRKAAASARPVVIVEGEKDAENVVKYLHLAATCNPKGAGKWELGWGKYFEGVPSILIIADKDKETIEDKRGNVKTFAVGQRHACDVEAKLRADGYKGKIRKVVMPDVEIEQGVTKRVKDFTDWVEALGAASRKVDKAAFQAAIEAFGKWPDKWRFSDADLVDLQAAQREGRNTTSDMPGEGDAEQGQGEKDQGEKFEPAGRYGRLSPRPPSEKARLYQVDFEIRDGEIARFEIGVESYHSQYWKKSEAVETFGQFIKMSDYGVLKGTPEQFLGMAIGSINSFVGKGRQVKLSGPQMSDLTCKIAIAWLRARGRFFADERNPNYETSMYFDEVKGVLYALHSAEFMSFLASSANINRELKSFDMIMSLIDDLAMEQEITPRVRPEKQWARRDSAIYLSNGDSHIYRVKPGAVDLVANGTDGVLFMRGETFAPWKLLDTKGIDPFDDAIVFKTAAWGDTSSKMNIRLWYLNLFACHANKPILLVEGPAGSGKTTIARLIKHILAPRNEGLPDTNVNQVNAQDKGAEDFWVIIDNGRIEVFDNMDSRVKWANDNLQTAATNGSHKVRELYKTKKVAILYANSSIIITSNNPVFATDGGGLPDRIIQAHINSSRKTSLDNELTLDIDKKRDHYLTWTARTLAAALADQVPVDDSINKRHPDYGIFAVKCARALGIETDAIRAMNAAEIDKSILPLMNETVAKEIYAVLMEQPTKGSMRFTSGEMSAAIIARFGDEDTDDRTKTIYGPRRIGKAISKFRKEFGVIFRFRPERTVDGKTVYESDGLTPQGDSIVAAGSGLVGLNGDFSKSPSGSDQAAGVCENQHTNALNPLHARAPTRDISPFIVKKNIEEDGEVEDLEDFNV